MDENKNLFKSKESILSFFLSNKTYENDSNSLHNYIQEEAINMCGNFKFSSFLCVLGLSTVVNSSISVVYPDFDDRHYEMALCHTIQPRQFYQSSSVCCNVIKILFCNLNSSTSKFKGNHFVPLLGKKEFTKKDNKHKQVLGATASFSSSCPKRSRTNTFESVSFGTPKLYTYFAPLKKNTDIITCKFVSLTKTTATISTINSTTFSSTVSTSASVPSKFSLLLPMVSTSYESPAPPSSLILIDNSVSSSAFSSTASVSSSLEISKYDISTYYKKSLNLSNIEKHDLIKNVSIVERTFIFPATLNLKKKRCFQHDWLQQFPWLRYSKSENGGYCLPCVLFAKIAPGKLQVVTLLVKKPVNASPVSKNSFKRHEESPSGLHSFCQNAYVKFLESFSGKSKPIDVIVNDIVKQQVSENRAVFNSLVDTVILCGHLGLPLRGHRDDSFYHPEAGQYATNSGVGNFIEIVNYAIRRGDSTLKNHYQNHKKNASYLSKTTQNELIKFCGEVISEEIVSEVKSAKFFSVLADEAMDRSGKEQLSFVLRYVDGLNNIQESFLGFVHLGEGLSGEALSKAVLAKIDSLGLNIENCRGQCYDGAGAVAGVRNGCSAHILRINHKALYTHCFSHKLNLSVSKSSKIVSVSNMMEKVKAISDFFRNSEQRQLVFEKYVDQFNPESSKNKLKDVCRTRWVERIDGLEMFVSLYSSIWNSLNDMRQDISLSRNYQTKQDAFRLFKDVDDFDFIINLIVVYRIFDITLDATILLQSRKK